MLEEILLFHSTYSEQLLLDATLIGSTDPIQPCRDGESQLCSLQDTHHWQSNPSEYRQYPPPPAHPTGPVLGWDWWSSWESGRESLRGPCAGRDSLLSKWPPNSQGKSTGGQRCPGTACPTWALGSGRWQSWEGRATGKEGTPWHKCSCQQCQLGHEGGSWLSFHHTPPTAGGSGETWSQAKCRRGLGCAVELLPPTPYHHPAQGKGGAAMPLHLHYTPNIPKNQYHNNLY